MDAEIEERGAGGGDAEGQKGRAEDIKASTTKRVANFACLAFSEGNRPIDF